MSADKKTLIYEAALSLVYETNDLSSIKVADIAERANIGKGTVYEYFDSKEQVIGEALIFMFKEGIDSFGKLIDEGKGFKETYKQFLFNFNTLMKKNKNLYNFMTINHRNLAIHTTIHSILQAEMEEFRKKYFKMVEKLVVKSVDEGIIQPDYTQYEWQAAVLSSITWIFLYNQFPEDFTTLTDEDVLEKAYTAYVKLLN